MLQPGRKPLLLILAVTLITTIVSMGVRVPVTLAEEPSTTPTPCQPEALYMGHVTLPDDTIVSPGAPIWKFWRLQNNGNCVWGEGYGLAFIEGERMGAPFFQLTSETVAPGDTLDIGVAMYAPQEPGSHTGWWQMRDPSGALFGPTIYVKIVVQEPTPAVRPSLTPTPTLLAPPTVVATPTPCRPEALYLTDVTIPDNTIVSPRAPLWKVWRLQNNGNCAWGEGYGLAFVKGDGMSAPPSQPVARTVAPGDTLDIGIAMYAPQKPGPHTGWWRMRDPSGALFGPTIYVKIVVQEPTPAVRPSLTPTPIPLASPTVVAMPTPTIKPSLTPTPTPSASPTVVPTPTPTVKPSLTPTPTPLASPTAVSTPVSDQFIQHLERAKMLYLEREYAQAQIELEQSQRFLDAMVQARREPPTLTGDSYINHQYGLQISNPVPGWEFKEIPAEQREVFPEGMAMLISIVKTGSPSEERIMVMVLELEKLMPPALVDFLVEDPQSGLRSLAMSAVKNLYVSEVISEEFLTIDDCQAFKVVFRSAITPAGMTDIDLDILKEKYRLVRIMLTSISQNFEENRAAFDQIVSTLKFS